MNISPLKYCTHLSALFTEIQFLNYFLHSLITVEVLKITYQTSVFFSDYCNCLHTRVHCNHSARVSNLYRI